MALWIVYLTSCSWTDRAFPDRGFQSRLDHGKNHADGTGASKNGRSLSTSLVADGPPGFILVAADTGTAITLALSRGSAHDAP